MGFSSTISSQAISDRFRIVFLWLSLLIWFAWTLWAAPALLGPDGWIYKAPGCAVELGDGLTGRFLPTYPDSELRFYAVYTQGLALVFAGFASLFGCSPRTDTLFDLFIAAGPILIVAPYLFKLLRAEPNWLKNGIVVLLALSLPFGLTRLHTGRPEALALLLFIAALIALSDRKRTRPVAFVLAGLIALCHPLGGMLSGVAVFCLSLRDMGSRIGFVQIARRAFFGFALFSLPIAVWVAGCFLADPEWHKQFLNHSYSPGVGPGIFLLSDDKMSFYRRFLTANFGNNLFATFGTVTAFLPALLALLLIRHVERYARIFFGAMVLLFFAIFVLMAYQSYYLVVLASFVALGAVVVIVDPMALPRVKRLAAAMILLPLIGGLPLNLASVLARSQSIDSYERISEQAVAFVEETLARSPEGFVLVPPTHFMLFRPLTDRLAIDWLWPGFAGDEAAGLASCAANQLLADAGLPHSKVAELGWQAWGENTLSTQRTTLFGIAIASRLANWSCRFYLRSN